MRLLTSFLQAMSAIKANFVRALITILIIAFGITALVVVMTSIEGIKSGMQSSFSAWGSNTFRIENRTKNITLGRRQARRKKNPPVNYRQAVAFQEDFEEQGTVSIMVNGTWGAVAKYQQFETEAKLRIVGTDHYFLETARYELDEGRSLSEEDASLGKNVVVIGHEIKETLFPFESSLGKSINLNGRIYRVIGAFARTGTMGMSGADQTAIIPLTTLRSHYPNHGSLTLNVYVENPEEIPYVMEEARGIFRINRRLKVEDEDNFAISKSDEFVNQLFEMLSSLTLAAQVIALITLLGAAVALLNVMLVSVTERTNEIGVRKALGASRRSILYQFLLEAIVICQLGGLLGILLGVAGGNLISSFLFAGTFVVPWAWIIIGILACLSVGVAAGFYPAWKAARVDPIESLRYE